MNLQRLKAMIKARSLEFLRDRSALGWNIAFPVLMVAGMAFIFSGPGQPLFKVAVVSEAPLSAETHPFLGTPHIQFYREAEVAVAIPKIERHRVDMLVELRATPGRYWINEQSPKGVTLEKILKGSGGAALERQTASGAEIRYVDWLVPGILGMNMMFSCLFGIGYVIVRYRKSGYLKRLNATPLRAMEFITAQLVSRLLLMMIITIAVYAGCDVALDFRMEGSYAALLFVTLLGAASMIAMGLIVSARVTSEELAGGILNVLSWPMMIVSGVFFSIDGAPQVLMLLADVFPLTHMISASRAIMLDGTSLADLSYPVGMMMGMTVIFLSIGAAGFKWTQD